MTHEAGPVPLDSPYYVERAFEREATALLVRREWVLALGPRQHGKTSAFIRMRAALNETGFRCAFVDLQSVPANLAFEDLLHWFGRQVATSLGGSIASVAPERRNEVEAWLEAAIPLEGPPAIVLVDEVSALRDEGIRNAFFGQIRALKTRGAQAPGTLAAKLQFAFAGTFRLESLVTDQNSPFNVSRRVETEDLSLEEVTSLARVSLCDNGQIDAIAALIHRHVGGQPHLVQHLVGVAARGLNGDEVAAIDGEVERLKREGSDHLDGMFRLVFQDPALTKLAVTAAGTRSVQNDPANPDSRYMVAVGLMKREGETLVFRNSLYEAVARASPQLRPETAGGQPSQHLVAVSETAFSFMADPELREIAAAAHDGAVNAYNHGHHRLALIGFGVSLEAMLGDWLAQQNSTALATVVATAKAANPPDKVTFDRHEVEVDPKTWRLVNLMRVGRLMNGVRGPLPLPDALRDMRNFVHPNVMKAAYISEGALEPEARGASGLISAVRRDLSP